MIYAANYSIAKLIVPEIIDPTAIVVLRVITGALTFFVVHRFFFYEKIQNLKHHWQLFIAALFGVVLNMLCFFEGLARTNPINASVLMLFTPVFVVIFVSIVGKKKLKAHRYIGIVLAFVGAFLLIDFKSFSFSASNSIGDFLIIINALCYGYYLYYVARLVHIYKPITIMTYIFFYGSLLVIPYGWNELKVIPWTNFNIENWLVILYILICVTVVVYLLNAWAIQFSSSTVVGAYIYLQPLLATVISLLWGKDILTIKMLISALLIFVGVYLSSKEKMRFLERIYLSKNKF